MSPRSVVVILVLATTPACKADSSRDFTPPTPTARTALPRQPAKPYGTTDAELAPLRETIRKLAPLHERTGLPKRGDWLASHPEPGETFEQYLKAAPVVPTAERGVVVVQPFGDLSPANARIVDSVAEYMEAFYGLSSRLEPPLSTALVSPLGRRPSGRYGEQLLTSEILKDILAPKLPSDAMAYLAFTAWDLWPGDDWNYVFGQASLEDRVGVWSLARNGNASAGDVAYRQALLRALKIATHETGHMFGMHHCTAYACNMAGVNSLDESDAHPTWLCPECLAKLSWATGSPPAAHLRRMLRMVRSLGFRKIESHYASELAALGEPPG
jgi:archaemetzincin